MKGQGSSGGFGSPAQHSGCPALLPVPLVALQQRLTSAADEPVVGVRDGCCPRLGLLCDVLERLPTDVLSCMACTVQHVTGLCLCGCLSWPDIGLVFYLAGRKCPFLQADLHACKVACFRCSLVLVSVADVEQRGPACSSIVHTQWMWWHSGSVA